ncbi:MAG: FxDxF family PEP-CTERM protein [Rhodocyclaceae bacterium]|nr:FxDxF family PEP-CTERM protein [Rhodocyclaceae bacterium]
MIKKLVLAAALAAIGTGSALAEDLTYTAPGTINVGQVASHNFAHAEITSFFDTFNFAIGAGGSLAASAVSIDLSFGQNPLFHITGLTGRLWNNSHPNGTIDYGTFNGNNTTFNFGPLSAGNYHIDFTGTVDGSAGGSYLAAVSVVAVPEPETYALLLAGLGLMGTVARRRSRNAA